MNVRRLGPVMLAFLTAATVGMPVVSASAVAPQVLYVASSPAGSDGNDCSQASPCATVLHALGVATSNVIAVHLGAGYFEVNEPITVPADEHLSILGQGSAETHVDDITSDPSFTNHGSLSLSRLDLEAPFTGIAQDAGDLSLTSMALDGYATGVVVRGGVSHLSGVDFGDPGATSTALDVRGGSVDAELMTARRAENGVVVSGGSFTGSELDLYAPQGAVQVSDGHASVIASVVGGSPALAVSGSGSAVLAQSSVTDVGPAVSVSGGSATMVGDTIANDNRSDTPELARTAGTLLVAGSVATAGFAPACAGDIVDGGYNRAPDASCAFTDTTSETDPTGLTVHPNQDNGGPTRSVAPTSDSSVIDQIPAGAVAAFDPGLALCPADGLDERGFPRLIGRRCDIGAVELGAASIIATADVTRVAFGTPIVVRARVSAQVTGSPAPAGDFEIVDPDQTQRRACTSLTADSSGRFGCTLHRVFPGRHRLYATLTSSNAYRAATSAPVAVMVLRLQPTLALGLRRAPHHGTRVYVRATSRLKRVDYATVTVSYGGRPLTDCGTVKLSNGYARCTEHGLPAGHDVVTAYLHHSQYFRQATARRAIVVVGRAVGQP